MSWSNIKSVGYIHTESLIKKGDGTIQLTSFLNSFVHEFAVQSKQYISVTEDAPFAYRERQLASIICPGLARYTDAFLAEVPANRSWSRIKDENYEDSHGWVDYWCNYRGIDFFVEIKHGYDCLSTNTITKNLRETWYEANEQIQVMKKEAKSWCMSSKGFFLIAMHIIPFWETLKSEQLKEAYDYSNDLLSRQKEFSKLKPAPNWSSIWMLNDTLAMKCKWEQYKTKGIYPGVLFLSKTSHLFRK